jgi:hypothetical protein
MLLRAAAEIENEALQTYQLSCGLGSTIRFAGGRPSDVGQPDDLPDR